MGCCSCSSVKEFKIQIDDREQIIKGLDQCVFGTLISFPENDNEVFEMLWEQVKLYNDVPEDKKDEFRTALVKFYHKEKSNLSPASNCNGCNC